MGRRAPVVLAVSGAFSTIVVALAIRSLSPHDVPATDVGRGSPPGSAAADSAAPPAGVALAARLRSLCPIDESRRRDDGNDRGEETAAVGGLRFADGSPVVGSWSVTIALEGAERPAPSVTVCGECDAEIRVPRAGRYHVLALTLGGADYPVDLRPIAPIEVGQDLALAVTIDPPRSAFVDVVDAITNQPARGAYAHLAKDRDVVGGRPPHDVGPRLESDGSGRIALPSTWTDSRLHVCAPGQAWGGVVVPYGLARPMTVPLEPGGALRVTLSPWKEGDEFALVLTSRALGLDCLGVPLARGTLEFDGITAGLWDLQLLKGPKPNWPGPLVASVPVEIRCGETSGVTMAVPAQFAAITVRGTVTIPSAWSVDKAALSFLPLDAGASGYQRVELGPMTGTSCPFSAMLQPGRYEVSVFPTGWTCEVVVAVGRELLSLIVPPPRVIEVRVTDWTSRAEIVGAWITFWPPSDGSGAVGIPAKEDKRRRVHVLLVPPDQHGRISVKAKGYDHDGCLGDGDVTPGDEPLRREFALPRAGAIVARVRVEGVEFQGAAFCASRVGGDGSVWEHGSPARFESLGAGKWHLSVENVTGFVAEPREIDVTEGETTEVDFYLRHR